MTQEVAVQQNILLLAQQGNPEAIANLISQSLATKGIVAKATRHGSCLQITLISPNLPPQDKCVSYIFQGMNRLGATSIKSVQLDGKKTEYDAPIWSQTFQLSAADAIASVTPAVQSNPITNYLKKPGLIWSIAILCGLSAVLAIAIKYQLQKPQETTQKQPTPVQQPATITTNKPAPKPAASPIAKQVKKTAKPNPGMRLKKVITGKITPKSVVHSGRGLFFAQNMMYSHTVTVYDRQHKLVKTIPDSVNLAKFGYTNFKGNYRGAPVEASFSHNGKYAWVSNYQMYGAGFRNPGSDRCHPSQRNDQSFLYRINTENLQVEKVIKVGAVPKFVATSPDNRLVLVSNWCSWDLSIIDTNKNKEIKRVKLGAYPRGIVVEPTSTKAYVAIMGSSDIAKVDLKKFSVQWLKNVGSSPRHLNLERNGKFLYASLNSEGNIAKIDLSKGKVIKKGFSGSTPRSMVLSQDGQSLYVVNYSENTVSKIRTKDMKVIQKVRVAASPIGVTYDPQTREVWVACYSGQIMVFQD
ncbi:MAG TPA: hypothetical protein V6D28_28030 [Leptolyngbyaceae cyanobacterium]